MNVSSPRLVGLIAVLALAFTASAHANAPAGRYTASSGTVYDTKTKLTWQQTISPTTYSFADATTYCTNLGASLGGAGWRVPTIKELQTILDHSQVSGPLIDTTAFPSTPLHYFWSSTPQVGTSSGPWVVDFGLGNVTLPGMSTSNNVRCLH
jgi:hypothetical protein